MTNDQFSTNEQTIARCSGKWDMPTNEIVRECVCCGKETHNEKDYCDKPSHYRYWRLFFR